MKTININTLLKRILTKNQLHFTILCNFPPKRKDYNLFHSHEFPILENSTGSQAKRVYPRGIANWYIDRIIENNCQYRQSSSIRKSWSNKFVATKWVLRAYLLSIYYFVMEYFMMVLSHVRCYYLLFSHTNAYYCEMANLSLRRLWCGTENNLTGSIIFGLTSLKWGLKNRVYIILVYITSPIQVVCE